MYYRALLLILMDKAQNSGRACGAVLQKIPQSPPSVFVLPLRLLKAF
jgi:hypothetical protein